MLKGTPDSLRPYIIDEVVVIGVDAIGADAVRLKGTPDSFRPYVIDEVIVIGRAPSGRTPSGSAPTDE